MARATRSEDIEGWFQFAPFYDEAVGRLPGGVLVEAGCYLGRSLVHLAEKARASGKPYRVVGVDTCRGSGHEASGQDHHTIAVERGSGTFAGELHRNLIDCGVADLVTLVVAPSVDAAKLFADDSLALVFIDARHDYDSVRADIAAWKPKVQPGGLLGGDDIHPAWRDVERAVNDALPGWEKSEPQSWKWVKPC